MGSVMMHLQESRTTQDQTRMIFTRIIKGSLHNTDSHPNAAFQSIPLHNGRRKIEHRHENVQHIKFTSKILLNLFN